MISSAGPSASEIILTERRTAGGPVRTGGSSGVCASPKLAPSVAASRKNRTNWQPIRGTDFTSGDKGYESNNITQAGRREVTKGQTSDVRPRTPDLGRQSSDLRGLRLQT